MIAAHFPFKINELTVPTTPLMIMHNIEFEANANIDSTLKTSHSVHREKAPSILEYDEYLLLTGILVSLLPI